jgi:hypothetical protein
MDLCGPHNVDKTNPRVSITAGTQRAACGTSDTSYVVCGSYNTILTELNTNTDISPYSLVASLRNIVTQGPTHITVSSAVILGDGSHTPALVHRARPEIRPPPYPMNKCLSASLFNHVYMTDRDY